MKIILSPAKKMKEDRDFLLPNGLPCFIENTEEILLYLKGLSKEELKKLWKCNDKILNENIERIETMNLKERLTPALLSYVGIAYQYMGASLFSEKEYEYLESHLRILSAFYGVLKPMDGVTPYRLEMMADAKINGSNDLYDYWGNKIYKEVNDDIIINIASKEYSKCVEKYLTDKNRYITISFVEMFKGKLVSKGTYAKMARGEMVRYMAENNIEDVEAIKKFDRLGYIYRDELSNDTEFVFERVI